MTSPKYRPKGPAFECRRCGRMITKTPSGHLRGHNCPHERLCVVPYAKRRVLVQPERCDECEHARNLVLPFDAPTAEPVEAAPEPTDVS